MFRILSQRHKLMVLLCNYNFGLLVVLEILYMLWLSVNKVLESCLNQLLVVVH